MALKIRMSRAGTKHRPFFKIVIADSRKARDGAFGMARVRHGAAACGQCQYQ